MTTTPFRILVIDDNPENLVVIGSALESTFDCAMASSGASGLALAARQRPDLVLLDIMMPEMDGFETCRRFKNDPQLAPIPVVFLTALTDMETEVAGLELGAVDYIAKPINVALLKKRVLNILKVTELTQHLRASEERLSLVMDATGEGVWDWDIASGQVVHNAAWCRLLGLDASYLAHPVEVFVAQILADDLPAVQGALDACLAGAALYTSEHRIRRADGDYIWVADRGQVVERDAQGRPLRMVGAITNINERKQHEQQIRQLAFYDPLTDLPNRRLLVDRVQRLIVQCSRISHFNALMFLDLDRFKLLNDTLGHAAGDALLIQVAQRLRGCVRQLDTVARMGGDEFVVLIEGLSEDPVLALAHASQIAEKILQQLQQVYQLGAHQHSCSGSVGLTLFNSARETVDQVLQRADVAMYEAKAGGRGMLRVNCEFLARH